MILAKKYANTSLNSSCPIGSNYGATMQNMFIGVTKALNYSMKWATRTIKTNGEGSNDKKLMQAWPNLNELSKEELLDA